MTPNQLNDWCWTEDELWNRIKELIGDYPVTIFNIKKLFWETYHEHV